MRLSRLILAAPLALAHLSMAKAEDIPYERGETFTHERTGIAFLPKSGDFTLDYLSDYGAQQYDVSVHYNNYPDKIIATVYLYRAGLPDVSLWFDRIVPIMQSNERWKPANADDVKVKAFVPPWTNRPTGLTSAYDVDQASDLDSTGAMLMAHGPWLIKIRMSSGSLNAAQLEIKMEQLASSLTLPSPPIYLAPEAYVVAPCKTKIKTGRAKIIEPEADQVERVGALASVIILPVDERGKDAPFKQTNWCRDTSSNGDFGVYRRDESIDSYALTTGDAGAAFHFGKQIADLTGSEIEKGKDVAVTFANSDITYVLGFLSKLPEPEKGIEIAQKLTPLAGNTRDEEPRSFPLE